MKKIFGMFAIIIISTIFASLFGAIHNQISYSVSDEFFKDFLFGNFGINDWELNNNRLEASVVGILGSYWVGLILGIVYSIVYIFLKSINSFKNIINAISFNILFTFLGSLVGYIVARFFVPLKYSGVWMDFGTQEPERYIEAAYMHSGSYFGGIIGLLFGIFYLLRRNNEEKLVGN